LARRLRGKSSHLSRENAISYAGLAAIHAALGDIQGVPAPGDATDIIAKAHAGDALALRAVALLGDWLAAMASDVVLMFGAHGGVYLSGALLEEIGPMIDAAAFSKRYADKGRLSSYVADVPVYHFTMADQMIQGLGTLFEHDYTKSSVI
jgi:glucokinase